MEEIRLRKSGLEMVDSSKLTEIKGGIGFGRLADLAYKAYRMAAVMDKYVASFCRGFQRGWNS